MVWAFARWNDQVMIKRFLDAGVQTLLWREHARLRRTHLAVVPQCLGRHQHRPRRHRWSNSGCGWILSPSDSPNLTHEVSAPPTLAFVVRPCSSGRVLWRPDDRAAPGSAGLDRRDCLVAEAFARE